MCQAYDKVHYMEEHLLVTLHYCLAKSFMATLQSYCGKRDNIAFLFCILITHIIYILLRVFCPHPAATHGVPGGKESYASRQTIFT